MPLEDFLSFPDHRVEPTFRQFGGGCVYLDPKTYELLDEDRDDAAYLWLSGPDKFDARSLIRLCYQAHPDSTDKGVTELAHAIQYFDAPAPIKDKDAIYAALERLWGKIRMEKYVPFKDIIAKQMPKFLKDPRWYAALVAAPAHYLKQEKLDALKRRPESYQKLGNQARELHAALAKTIALMRVIKEELPELPDVPVFEMP